MLLSDGSIATLLKCDRDPRAIASKGLDISPLGVDAIQPASVDIRLGNRVVGQVACGRPVSTFNPPVFVPIFSRADIGDRFLLWPGEFYLGSTMETFDVGRNIALKLEGKSSLGRLGLEVHSTAGWIDPGFKGELTLEMKVVGKDPVEVWSGMFVAQVSVFLLDKIAERPYGHETRNSKYHGQSGPTGPLPVPVR